MRRIPVKTTFFKLSLSENVSEKTPEILDWMKKICQAEYGLISSLIDSFNTNLDSKDYNYAN